MRASLQLERLERRLTPVGNLLLTSLSLVDNSGTAMPTPVVGQDLRVRLAWSEAGASLGENYVVRVAVDGVPLDSSAITAQTGTISRSIFFKGWYAASGNHTVTATLDPANSMTELIETDNTSTLTFTPQLPTDLPAKFQFPLAGVQGRDWTIFNYADTDPRSGSKADFRGGVFTYDGHNAIDVGPASFGRMDDGIAVFATGNGTVSFVQDGNFDRETTNPNNPANYVMIDHGNGWQTMYAHFSANSIAVKLGDGVKAGQLLGLVGSSGDSSGPHLHFTPYYRGLEVEAGFAPTAYFTTPPVYQGDNPPMLMSSGTTASNPSPDLSERADRIGTFTTAVGGSVFAYFTMSSVPGGAALTSQFFRPNGTLYSSASATSGAASNGYFTFLPSLPAAAWGTALGVWQIDMLVNGVEVGRTSFTATSGAGEASVRATLPSGSVLGDGRTTPIDFGSVAAGGSGPTQTFAVRNTGSAVLTLGTPTLPPGFSLVGSLPATLAASASTTLTVRLDSAAVGSKYGAVRVATNDPDTPVFDFAVSGGVSGGANASAPVIGLPDAALASYFGHLPRPLMPTANFADADSANFGGSVLTLAFATGGNADDRLAVRTVGTGVGQINMAGSQILFGSSTIGVLAGGSGATPLTATLTAQATVAAVQALLRAVTYQNVGVAAVTTRRSVRVSIIDPQGNASNFPVQQISPAGLSRTPTLTALPAARTTTRGSTLTQVGSFADSTGISWTATVDYGDGTGLQPLTLNADKTYTLSHIYAVAAGGYTATVTVTNDLGGVSTTTLPVTVQAANSLGVGIVNNGGVQRSRITKLQIPFAQSVTSDLPGAFTLTRTSGSVPPLAVAWNAGRTVATLTFTGPLLDADSLPNGRYTLRVDSSKLLDANGAALDGDANGLAGGVAGGDVAMTFLRFAGDGTGNGVVDAQDVTAFLNEYGLSAPGLTFDMNASGAVDANDVTLFLNVYGTALA